MEVRTHTSPPPPEKKGKERALSVFQIILCRIVPVRLLLIMSTNKKNLLLNMLKKSAQVRESENLSEPKIPLEVQQLTRVIRTVT